MLRSRMPISAIAVFLRCSSSVSPNVSNRRVRTRTHGGVAGVGGRPPPLCRSNAEGFTHRSLENRSKLGDFAFWIGGRTRQFYDVRVISDRRTKEEWDVAVERSRPACDLS